MTDADPEEIATVERDDVIVEKSFEPDDFPVPAIAFTIRSERETPVSVRLVDTVPDDVAPENIGFHPKYGAEFWDVEDGRIVFRRDLAPGEEYTTVYGLRGGDADTAAKFMSEPTLESVEPPRPAAGEGDIDAALDAAEIGDVTPPEGDAAELAVSGEGTRAPSASTNGSVDGPAVVGIDEASATDPDDGDARNESAADPQPSGTDSETERIGQPEEADAGTDDRPDGAATAEGGSPDEQPERDGSGPVAAPPGHDSLVSALAAELREGDVEDEDLMDLRDALGLDLASASVEARIDHLQSSVSELEAYTEAMEAFLDEEGDAQTLIAEVRDGYEEATDRLDELETQLEAVQSDLDRRLDTIDERIEETVEAELEAIRSDLENVEERVDAGDEDRTDLESDIEDLSAELAEVAEMRDRLTNALSGLAGSAPHEGADDKAGVTGRSDDPDRDADVGDADPDETEAAIEGADSDSADGDGETAETDTEADTIDDSDEA
jgi:tetrahydromethanopterin S-methyltransferase subunit G